MPQTQTYATHRRFHWPFHFVAFPLSVLHLLWALRNLMKVPALHTLMAFLGALVLALGIFLARWYGLRVQDRLIRLEETLRMKAVLPAELQARLGELRPGQFVALRFASDGELAERVQEALDQGLKGEAIKQRIQVWRPDTFRV
jgi:hypothetical protein